MTTALWILTWILVIGWFVLLAVTVAGSVYAWFYIIGDGDAPLSSELTAPLPPISVLRPLKGLDYALRENLESGFRLEYPEFELLFNVAEADDPAVALVRELMAAYPGVQATLTVGELPVGHNPKINNLVKSYEKARYDWVIIVDSNARMGKHYLAHLGSMVQEDSGCISTAFLGMEGRGWGGRLERIFLNTFNTRWMLTANLVGKAFVVGKSMMFRRSVAQKFGGLRFLGSYLAEDMVTGMEVEKQGLRVQLPRVTIHQYLGRQGIKSFWMRHLRWARIRKSHIGHIFLVEPLISSFGTSWLGAGAFSLATGIPFWIPFVAHWGIWWVSDFVLMKKLDSRTTLLDGIFWFFHELCIQGIWLWALTSNKVSWRGTTLTLQRGGRVLSKETLIRTPQEIEHDLLEEKEDQSLAVW